MIKEWLLLRWAGMVLQIWAQVCTLAQRQETLPGMSWPGGDLNTFSIPGIFGISVIVWLCHKCIKFLQSYRGTQTLIPKCLNPMAQNTKKVIPNPIDEQQYYFNLTNVVSFHFSDYLIVSSYVSNSQRSTKKPKRPNPITPNTNCSTLSSEMNRK